MKKIVNIFKLLFFVFFITFLCGINTVKAIDYISQTSTSLVNWMLEEDNLSNGYYSLVVNGQTYLIRLYTYNGDQVWTSNMTFGDGNDIANSSRNAQHMIVVKVRGDLTINSGVTVTTTNSTYGGPKGFFLFSSGKLTNNGTITMTARGARAAGQPVYLYKDPTNGYTGFTVPATGGSGGAARTYTNKSINTSSDYYLVGDPGKAGSNRGTGGGGSGGLETRRHDYSSFTATSGAGSAGTSYSGGTGGGGINMNYNGTRAAGGGAANGGAGGNGWSARGSSSWAARSGGGGAGNPGGTGYYTKSGSTTCSADSNYSAPSGTGGLLIIFSISSSLPHNKSLTEVIKTLPTSSPIRLETISSPLFFIISFMLRLSIRSPGSCNAAKTIFIMPLPIFKGNPAILSNKPSVLSSPDILFITCSIAICATLLPIDSSDSFPFICRVKLPFIPNTMLSISSSVK